MIDRENEIDAFKFSKSLPKDKYQATLDTIQAVLNHIVVVEFDETWSAAPSYEEFMDYYSLLLVLFEDIDSDLNPPELIGHEESNLRTIFIFCNELKSYINSVIITNSNTKALTEVKDKFKAILSKNFYYEFTEGDLNQIQNIISDLRKKINDSELFTEDHKYRLLKKLENLQFELHKKMSSLDRFWGIFAESGVMLGKFGTDAKPFVDRIRELAGIFWGAQARAEELPSNTPLSLLDGNKTNDESQ